MIVFEKLGHANWVPHSRLSLWLYPNTLFSLKQLWAGVSLIWDRKLGILWTVHYKPSVFSYINYEVNAARLVLRCVIFLPWILSFLWLKTIAQMEKSMWHWRKKKKRKIIKKIKETSFHSHANGQWTHSTRINNGLGTASSNLVYHHISDWKHFPPICDREMTCQ